MKYFRKGKLKSNQPFKISKSFLIIAIIVTFLITSSGFLFIGNYLATKGILLINTSAKISDELKQIKDIDKYTALFQVRDTLISKFDGEIDDNVLLEGAIKGMTSSLKDPYTVFMNKDEFDKFMEQTTGSFMGIGVQVGVKDDKITIISPIEGSPAVAAGLQAGDVIQKVNDVELGGDELDKAISMISGKEKAEVKLSIVRNGGSPFDVSIMRDVIKVQSVKGEMIDSSIGYIQLTSFMDENVTKDFQNKINELKNSGMKKLILDLRGNPGGLLSEAVGVASQFIPEGKTITYTIDKYDNKAESPSIGGIAQGLPLVLLVDGGSASASEVVTGALRDYKVATIVGTTTFGKGIVQQPIKFNNGIGGLKVTISKYYTPNGENIHKKGILPDYEVKIPKELTQEVYSKDKDPQFNKALEIIKEEMNQGD
ncbi:S41 family peptidase [Clostridium uliginosum]|uniref:Carboxyl-terminal processing protease n=1 Tax=Clostridium uliginosum TaxID=119641 RepID=A0A1I1QIH3_9CLOT|nr:S41 family peptidase [Clostridium uliginosum]SFD21807.1 carboxyl-terminal processing protease [Clostridium uliginosum]